MTTATFMRTLIVTLALEWELCSQDPFIFCYRISLEPARIVLNRRTLAGAGISSAD
jgi:hypothetical protein